MAARRPPRVGSSDDDDGSHANMTEQHSTEMRTQLSNILDGAAPASSALSPASRNRPLTDLEEQHLQRLRRFYMKWDHTRVHLAPITLKTWRTSLDTMWIKLVTRYGPEPSPDELLVEDAHVDPSNPAAAPATFRSAAHAAVAGTRLSSSPTRRAGSPAPPAAAPPAAASSYRNRLLRFYSKYFPERLATVDKALEVFSGGREETLFASLVRKYGPEPEVTFPVPAPYNSSEDDTTGPNPLLAETLRIESERSVVDGGGGGTKATASSAPFARASGTVNVAQLMAQMDQDDSGDDEMATFSKARGRPSGNKQQQQQLQQQQQTPQPAPAAYSEPCIDWDKCCECDCSTLRDAMDGPRVACCARIFYLVVFILAIIGAIIAALIFVGVERNTVAFAQTKTTSELDTDTLLQPGIYTLGPNVRAVSFPSYFTSVTMLKEVSCCGGFSFNIETAWFWGIRDIDAGVTTVNRSGLATMVRSFGGIPRDNIIKVAQESMSNVIVAAFNNVTMNTFLASRTLIADVIHAALQRDLHAANIWITVPRKLFTLGHIFIPAVVQGQKNEVWVNAEKTITSRFRETAQAIRQGTQNNVSAIDANTTLIITQAEQEANRLRSIAVSNNQALRFSNVVNSIAAMMNAVDAKSDEAGIQLIRLNEILDTLEREPKASVMVNIDGQSIFPLI